VIAIPSKPVFVVAYEAEDAMNIGSALRMHLSSLRRTLGVAFANAVVAEQIRDADVVVLLVSPGLFAEAHVAVLREAAAAFVRGVPVVPVYCIATDFPTDHWLRRVQGLPRATRSDMMITIGGTDRDERMAEVARDLRAVVNIVAARKAGA
jgi:hypothetical protein